MQATLVAARDAASRARAAFDMACAINPDFAACAFAKRQVAEMDAPPDSADDAP